MTTEAFRFSTAPVLVTLVKRDAIGLNIFYEIPLFEKILVEIRLYGFT